MAYLFRLQGGIGKALRGSLLVMMSSLMGGCGSGMGPKSGSAASQAGTQSTVMQAGGANVLMVTAAADTKCVAGDGSLHFTTPQYEVEIWMVRGVKTIDEAISRVGPQIMEEFKDFKAEQTTDFTIAGSEAKRLVGTGHEADDGDPGDADLIVFKVDDHVFIACTHGESLTPPAQQGLLAMVQSAQGPQKH